MRLRTLKKLSKRATPYLVALGYTKYIFPAKAGENYHEMSGFPRKNWERSHCHPSHAKDVGKKRTGFREGFYHQTRKGNVLFIGQPYHPLKGTTMIGGMDSGPEPEWSEETTYGLLRNIVECSFIEYDEETGDILKPRPLLSVTEVFEVAERLALEYKRERQQFYHK